MKKAIGTTKVYDVPIDVPQIIIRIYSSFGKSATFTVARPGGIALPSSVKASPVIGDVMNAGNNQPQPEL